MNKDILNYVDAYIDRCLDLIVGDIASELELELNLLSISKYVHAYWHELVARWDTDDLNYDLKKALVGGDTLDNLDDGKVKISIYSWVFEYINQIEENQS